jgi:hypothetical protein
VEDRNRGTVSAGGDGILRAPLSPFRDTARVLPSSDISMVGQPRARKYTFFASAERGTKVALGETAHSAVPHRQAQRCC